MAEGSARPLEPWARDWGQRGADGASAPRVVGVGLRCLDLDIRGHRAEEQPARVWEKEEPGIGWVKHAPGSSAVMLFVCYTVVFNSASSNLCIPEQEA